MYIIMVHRITFDVHVAESRRLFWTANEDQTFVRADYLPNQAMRLPTKRLVVSSIALSCIQQFVKDQVSMLLSLQEWTISRSASIAKVFATSQS